MNSEIRATKKQPNVNDFGLDARTTEVILSAVGGLQYGMVEVTVHAGRVVQVDKCERIRLSVPER
jgi:hypothetical protein